MQQKLCSKRKIVRISALISQHDQTDYCNKTKCNMQTFKQEMKNNQPCTTND